MTQTKWVEEQLAPGVAAIKGRLDPMPIGPYTLVSQFDEEEFLKNFGSMVLDWSDEFKTRRGYITFTVGFDGLPYKVAYYYDTSD